MLIYIFVVFSIFSLYIVPQRSFSVASKAIIFLVGFFLCSGYMTGSDWRGYEKAYDIAATDNYLLLFAMFEPGLVILYRFCNAIGLDFWILIIGLKFAAYYITINLIRNLTSGRTFIFVFFMYVTMYGLYMFIDNPLRNMISIAIACYSVKYLLEHRFWIFFWLTLLAMTFHFSAVIMLFVYFFSFKKYSTWQFVVLLIVVNIFFLGQGVLLMILNALLSNIPYVGEKLIAYSSEGQEDGEGKLLSVGLLFHTMLISFIIYSRKSIENMKYGNIVFNLSVLFYIIFRISLSMTILSRFQYFLLPFYLVGMSVSFICFEYKSKVIYACIVGLFAVYSFYATITQNHKYIPYTNYFYYKLMYQEMPSYEYRTEYNIINSPYNKK